MMMMVSSNGNGGYPLIDSVINQHTDPSANHNINTQTMKMKKVLLFMFDHRSINYFLFDPLEITIATQLATFPSPFPLTLSAVSLPQYKRFQILPHFQIFTSGASTKLSVVSIGIMFLIKTTHHWSTGSFYILYFSLLSLLLITMSYVSFLNLCHWARGISCWANST